MKYHCEDASGVNCPTWDACHHRGVCAAAPQTTPAKSIGQILYEGYCNHTGWKSLASGQDLPLWDALREDIKKAWEASGIGLSAYIDEAAARTEPNYDEVVRRLKDPQVARLLHVGMGMVTEAGEFIDMLKKHIYYGTPIDKVNLNEELGDSSWYARIGANALGVRFLDVIMLNIRKLRTRFPNKFSEKNALVRDLGGERKVLEKG